MTWTKIYIAVFLCFGLYRQFVIPEQFYHSKEWIWGGAMAWPAVAIVKVAAWVGITDTTEYELLRANGIVK